jgi:hypothetical protein
VSVYDVNTLFSQARKLAADYLKTMSKPLPGMSNEIALNDAAQILSLELSGDASLAYDAVGCGSENEGKKVQIKGRLVTDEDKSNQRIGQVSPDKEWDSVVLVLLNTEYEPFEIYEAERAEMIENMAETSSSKKKRGAMSVSRFKKFAALVWSSDKQSEAQQSDVSNADASA